MQAQLQSAAQIEQLQRRLRAAEVDAGALACSRMLTYAHVCLTHADAGEAKETSCNLRTQTEAYARQVHSDVC